MSNQTSVDFIFSNFKYFISYSISELENKNTKYVCDYLFEDFDIDLITNFSNETLIILLESNKINKDVFVYAYMVSNIFRKLEKNDKNELSKSTDLYCIKDLLLKIEIIIIQNRIDTNQNNEVINLIKA